MNNLFLVIFTQESESKLKISLKPTNFDLEYTQKVHFLMYTEKINKRITKKTVGVGEKLKPDLDSVSEL